MDRRVDIDGVVVSYTDRGEGRPLLLLHGNPDSRDSWEPLLSALGGEGRYIAPDFPGFGGSAPFPDAVRMGPDVMPDFWNAFVDAVGLDEPVTVVVHDFGGPWLLPWVASHPERARGLFVLNTLFHRDYRWHSWARIWQTPLLGEISMVLTNRALLRREMRKHAPLVPADLVDAAYERMHPTMKRTVLRVYRAHSRPAEVFHPWEEKLLEASREIPVRVLWGDRDPYIPPKYAERFGGEAIHVPDLGHWLHLERPALVAKELEAFLAETA